MPTFGPRLQTFYHRNVDLTDGSPPMHRLIGIVALLNLAGCGADVASSAATAAAVRAKEVEAAQKIKEQVSETLEAANQDAQKRLEEADKAAQ